MSNVLITNTIDNQAVVDLVGVAKVANDDVFFSLFFNYPSGFMPGFLYNYS